MSTTEPTLNVTRWRKKPVEIEAVQWTGTNLSEVLTFTGPAYFGAVDPENRAEDPEQTAEVYDKLHGTWVHVYDGQWIIRGVQGELYPIAADVLAATYEPAEPLGMAGPGDDDGRGLTATLGQAQARAGAAEAKLAEIRAYCRDECEVVNEGLRLVAIVRASDILAIIGSEEGSDVR